MSIDTWVKNNLIVPEGQAAPTIQQLLDLADAVLATEEVTT